MDRFKNILVLAENHARDAAALRHAFALAGANQAQVTVLRVPEALPGQVRSLTDVISEEELRDVILADERRRLEGLVRRFDTAGADPALRVVMGRPFVEAIRAVVKDRHDLVIKTAGRRIGRRPKLFDSTDMHLLRKCPCAVWLVEPSSRRPFRRILAAVDPDRYDGTRDMLNGQIVRMASSLASANESELHVVHAWSLYGESVLRGGRAGLARPQVNELLRQERGQRQRRIQELLDAFSFDGVKPHIHLRKGDARTVVPELVENLGIDLVVMGTLSRTGLKGLLIGNTAESVLNQIDCSALTVKPAGFLTPLALSG